MGDQELIGPANERPVNIEDKMQGPFPELTHPRQ
jgi:hypothetical protein